MSAAQGARRVVRRVGKRVVFPLTHALGRATGRHYFEDFVRVYPGNVVYTRLGLRRRPTRADRLNYLNHAKVYRFAAQFAPGRRVADAGCGSGYGCKLLSDAGAAAVHGCDVSRHALRYAERHFGRYATFSRQSLTDLSQWRDASFDVVVSSEVLEHVKEYGLEARALGELERVLAPGGVLVLGTPNSELLGEHGFSFEEIDRLVGARFGQYVVFENALVPFDEGARRLWEERARSGRTGVVVEQRLVEDEISAPPGHVPGRKRGIPAGTFVLGDVEIDTGLLHNTHGWLVVALKPRHAAA